LPSGSTTINRATETDRYVGGRIRERRIMLGLSQQQMAHMIGVTYQQTHKYERGINRISAGRLYEIAQVLRVPLSFFFEGLGNRLEGGALTGRYRPFAQNPQKPAVRCQSRSRIECVR
jgi:transcriptional regulator with XRE-family HTH domain